MIKPIIIVAILFAVTLFFGCVVPANPNSCKLDSDCVGIIHPFGQAVGSEVIAKQCVGKSWVEQGGAKLVEIDNNINCKCITVGSSPVPLQLFGIENGKICQNKDFNYN